MSLQEYVSGQVRVLIDQVADAAMRAETDTSERGVHRLRVAIRKLSESLRVFKDILPHGAAKRVRKDLKVAMRLAGEARNGDIARKLMKQAKVAVDTSLLEGRERSASQLASLLHAWNGDQRPQSWRELLHG